MSNIIYNKPKPFSFNFKGKNSSDFGLYVNSYDFLLPDKRIRKLEIPFRQGMYDFADGDGKRFYQERELRLRCIWMRTPNTNITRADIRELSYWLSSKGQITLDIEPDKYYIGELFSANELIAHYDYMIDMGDAYDGGGTTDGEFEISFVCQPFAYGKTISQPISSGINKIDYKGTMESPTVIILRNTGTAAVTNVQITMIRKI